VRAVALHIAHSIEQLLPDNPRMGRPGRVSGTRELVIPKTSFIVPYRLQRNVIQLLHVCHEARRWPESLQQLRTHTIRVPAPGVDRIVILKGPEGQYRVGRFKLSVKPSSLPASNSSTRTEAAPTCDPPSDGSSKSPNNLRSRARASAELAPSPGRDHRAELSRT
jgi:plasmid stabilization system protein ParE